MNVIRVGETVLIGGWFVSESPITGTVVGVMIDGQDMSHVQYRVAWWNGAARVCEWIEAAEIKKWSAAK